MLAEVRRHVFGAFGNGPASITVFEHVRRGA
jgi:hypothetical protein